MITISAHASTWVGTRPGGGRRASGGDGAASRSGHQLPTGPSFMVRRTRLIQELAQQASSAGIAVLCAPPGFGKTGLLIQYVDEVVNDPQRGAARLVDADHAVLSELSIQLEGIAGELAHAVRPALAIDNVPAFPDADAEAFAELLRGLRASGVEIVIACTPAAEGLVRKLGDAAKFGAGQLIVRPREYAEWSRVLSISGALDVYALTQGIPVLVAALQGMTEQAVPLPQPIEGYAVDLYHAILAELRETDEERYTLAVALLLAGSGRFRDLARAVGHARGLDLPELPDKKGRGGTSLGVDFEAFELHARCRAALIEQGTWTGEAERLLEHVRDAGGVDDAVDIPLVLLRCDVLLAEALMGSLGHIGKDDAELALADRDLRERKLAPVVSYARLVRSARRLFAGAPLIDERAFTDAGTAALRASDLSLQLLATVFAGWQELVQGQAVNARFRAQQVLKLVDDDQPYLQQLAFFLERVSHLHGMSRGAVREEAGMLDLARTDLTPAEAWVSACFLAAARDDAELSAWYSLHKETLLEPSFRLFARLALSVLGPRADALRRLLPVTLAPYYIMEGEPKDEEQPLFTLIPPEYPEEVGKVSIRLLGGFSVTKNGHVLADTIWRRRKIGVLAARLAVERGSFVTRRTITEELWPGLDYTRARENLYSTLSTLRHALGQRRDGPQYLMTQGDGLCLNSEYVDSDVVRFNELAREILLGHLKMSASQLIALCLKVEGLYLGPLVVPDRCNIPYFKHMRHTLQAKFIDCMLRGIDVAIEEEDVNSALWMVEAAFRSETGREDVVRRALQVYEMAGRYGDVEDVYRMHRDYLFKHADRGPELETERVYREIENRRLRFGA